MSQKYNIEFNPIQCTSTVFKNLAAQEGFLYFVTDTKEIFLGGNDGKFINMSGGINVFYGIKEVVYENNGLAPNPTEIFEMSHLEGSIKIPKINDLILNKDGCFYRIENVIDGAITAKRLTLQGSGGGNVNGPSSGTGSSYSVSLVTAANIFSSQDEHMYIKFVANVLGDADNYISSVSFTKSAPVDIENGVIPFYTIESAHYEMGSALNQKVHYIDLAPYKDQFSKVATTFYINTVDAYGIARSARFTVQLINLELTTTKSNIFSIKENSEKYSCTVQGASSGVYNKKLLFSFYQEDKVDGDPIIAPQELDLNATVDKIIVQENLDTSKLSHGVYTLQVQAQAILSGTDSHYIKSNIITHKVICFKTGSQTLLLAATLPEKIEQYTNIPLNYMLASAEQNKEYSLKVSIDGIEKTILKVFTNEFATYDLYFETKGAHTVELVVNELGNLKYNFSVNVLDYNGKLPIINPSSGEVMLYLDPKGQSNDAVNPEQWKDYSGTHTALLEKMFFSSSTGWCKDANGTYYLALNSGGKLTLPTFLPFKSDPSTDEGMTIELDFEISGVTNFEQDIIKCISTSQKGIISTGFRITGNKAYFYNNSKNGQGTNGSLANLNLVENKRIRLTFVIEPKNADHPYPMVLSYINGIISGASIYSQNDTFKNSDRPAILEIDSTYASVKIYGIRFFSTAFGHSQVLKNFTSTLPTLEERTEKYESILVYDGDEKIDYVYVSAEEYKLGIPYMLLTGGWKTDQENDKWQLLPSDQVGVPGLPTDKKNYRMVDVEVIYPKTDYFKNYKNYSYKNTFTNGGGMQDNFGSRASNGGCIMYCQGTSSMEYPVKNLRLRWKKDTNYFKVRPNLEAVEIICMKADYMESSGSHNTGAANLIDDLYAGASLKTPGQVKFDTPEEKIVTCIKGHPCLIFYRGTENDSFTYIGKYNLNLDKATPTPFGFNHSDDFGWLPVGEEYYAVQYDDDGDKFIGQENPDDGGDYDSDFVETLTTVEEGKKVNSIHCFEFLDNAVSVCNFLNKTISEKDFNVDPIRPTDFSYEKVKNISEKYYKDIVEHPENGVYLYILENGLYTVATGAFDSAQTYYEQKYTFEDTWYRTFLNKEGDKVPGWALGFESRYPEDRLGYHDADMLWPLASWLNELYTLKRQEEEAGKRVDQVTYHYNYSVATSFKTQTAYFVKAEGSEEYIPAYPTEETFNSNTYYTREVSDVQFEMESLERFKREYKCYLDEDFLLAYYVISEALLMADSRVKNMMIATWGKERRTYKTLQNETRETNNYIFYPIFYDMDTMLGLDNTGKNRFNYYDEDTDPSIYNGEEVLWNFVRDTLFLEIDQMYRKLEAAGLNIDKNETGNWDNKSILPYFNNNQANMANEAFYNADSEYKYIRPAIEGYYDGLNKQDIAPGAAPYLYAAQGDRSLMREYFVTNRIKFLRGKHNSKRFQEQDRITFRWYYPTGNEDNFQTVIGYESDGSEILGGQSVLTVPPSTVFSFDSLQTCYAGVLLGANGNVIKEYFNGAEHKNINVVEGSTANGTEAYLLGVDNLSSLGDLSDKYMQKFIINSETKLKHLILGNPSKYYHNPFWGADNINISGCKYLETFNLQNCRTYNAALDFSNCPAIKQILLTGCSASNLILPVNGNLQELRLPTSIVNLYIDSHTKLTAQNFSIGGYNYGTQNKIGVSDGGSYTNDYSNLTNITIINTPIDSYDMVSKAVSLQSYYFENFDWRITSQNDFQYVVTKDTEYDTKKIYYIWSINSDNYVTLSAYKNEEGFIDTMEELFNRERSLIKEKISLVEKVNGSNTVVNIPILELLHTKNPSKNLVDVTHAKALSGTITLAVRNVKVNQFELYRKYKQWYPNVTISYDEATIGSGNIIKAHTVKFYNIPDITSETEPYYTVLTDGTLTLEKLTSSSGPAGSALLAPAMSSTATQDFIFTNEWKDVETNRIIKVEDFSTECPDKDLSLVPVYNTVPRQYKVSFYDYQGELFVPNNIKYGAGVTNPLYYEYEVTLGEHSTPILYLHRDDSDLAATERYAFKGWISKSDFNALKTNDQHLPSIIDPETYKVTHEIELYPYYKVEDATKVASDIRYFDVVPETVNYLYHKYSKDPSNGVVSSRESYITLDKQQSIYIRDEYASQIEGKITLPSEYNGKKITILKNMGCPHVKQVYFLQDCAYKGIGDYNSNSGFFNQKSLKKVIFPEGNTTLEYIGRSVFNQNSSLTAIENLPNSIKLISDNAFNGCSSLSLSFLPTSLEFIGERAFVECEKMNISTLPQNLISIGSYAFQKCTGINIDYFGNNGQINGQLDNSLEFIHTKAFSKAGKSEDATLYLQNSLVHIGELAFEDFRGSSVLTVFDNTNLDILANKQQYFGQNRTVNSGKVNQ